MCSIRERAIKKGLIHVATLESASQYDDGLLSSAPSASGGSKKVACRLVSTANRPRDFVLADKPVTRSEWQILFPLDAPVSADDVVEVDGQKFEILDTDKGAAGETLLTAFCKKQA